jgi:hypothetical protein
MKSKRKVTRLEVYHWELGRYEVGLGFREGKECKNVSWRQTNTSSQTEVHRQRKIKCVV